MKALVLLTLISVAHARKPSSIEYTCSIKWKTIQEDLPAKSLVWREKGSLKVNDTLTVDLASDETKVKISIKEKFKFDPAGYISHSFSCDQVLNCSGQKVKFINGQTTRQDLSVQPTGGTGMGLLEGRTIFVYQNLAHQKFQYQYVVYRDAKNQPMGLTVTCHE